MKVVKNFFLSYKISISLRFVATLYFLYTFLNPLYRIRNHFMIFSNIFLPKDVTKVKLEAHTFFHIIKSDEIQLLTLGRKKILFSVGVLQISLYHLLKIPLYHLS